MHAVLTDEPWPLVLDRTPRRPARGWYGPALASLLLHSCLVCACLRLAGGGSGGGGPKLIDTRVAGGDIDVRLVTVEDRPLVPVPAPAETQAPQLAETVASQSPAAAAVPQPVQVAQATEPVRGSVEEQDAGPGSPGRGGSGALRREGPGLFALPAPPRSVVYVLDCSASMGQEGLFELARQELLASLRALPEETSFQIIAYNSRAEPLPLGRGAGLVPATGSVKILARRLLEGCVPEGSTRHLLALQRALDLHPDVIFFLTDAGDLQPAEIRAVTTRNHGRSSIHAIELRAGEASALRTLAEANGGAYRRVALSR